LPATMPICWDLGCADFMELCHPKLPNMWFYQPSQGICGY
jgi:hypothetical protein